MSRPKRIQLSRKKGWRMPPNTVKVDRSTRYGNPFDWRDWRENAPRGVLRYAEERDQWCREQAVEEFAAALRDGSLELDLEPLRGKNLACWCSGPSYSCHADVLLELANAPDHRALEGDERG